MSLGRGVSYRDASLLCGNRRCQPNMFVEMNHGPITVYRLLGSTIRRGCGGGAGRGTGRARINSMNQFGTYFVDDVKMLDHVVYFSFISTIVNEMIEPRLYMEKLVGSPGMTA